jgi:polysaccharide export outer membrane protein
MKNGNRFFTSLKIKSKSDCSWHREKSEESRQSLKTHPNLPTIVTLLIALLCIGFLPSCGGKKAIEQSIPSPGTQYIIGPEDVLQIFVRNEPELSLSVTVRTDGKISLPLINDVQVIGLTPVELREELTKRFSNYLENPTVSVIVEEVNSLKIFVDGEVNTPGVYDMKREVNVLQAITLAGGFTEWANKSKIKIFRKHGGVEKIITINYNKIISGKHPELNIPLQPGDSVIVP